MHGERSRERGGGGGAGNGGAALIGIGGGGCLRNGRGRAQLSVATLCCTVHRTTSALNAILVALCYSSRSSPTLLRAAPVVLLRAAPHAASDTATFRILTATLCCAGQPSAVADLLRCMPPLLLDPDPCHCRAVLAYLCCRGAPARDTLTFLDDMRRPRAEGRREGRRVGGRPDRGGFAAGGLRRAGRSWRLRRARSCRARGLRWAGGRISPVTARAR
ncbi:hypothetical protein Zm00014a_006382 [Zea mays]|uniref:Pentatricopeptide repeat-containing protein n=1 Tax=Zea mays TaxID=4577 RepID=A0A317Y377_MAIZE|nr:hypothetical protein Zm00014a_006382 [Zea mays]